MEAPSSTPGEIDICPRGFFCPKFDTEKLLYEAFFEILRIFDSAQSKSECIFPFLYNLIFQLITGDNHMLSPVAIKNGVCPHSGCSSALVIDAMHSKKYTHELILFDVLYHTHASRTEQIIATLLLVNYIMYEYEN